MLHSQATSGVREEVAEGIRTAEDSLVEIMLVSITRTEAIIMTGEVVSRDADVVQRAIEKGMDTHLVEEETHADKPMDLNAEDILVDILVEDILVEDIFVEDH